MINEINHRYFRFRIDNRWITLPQLGTMKKLLFYIEKYKPHDVYFSETYFLNPENIDKQKCPIILGSDLIIDCDKTTRENVINIINKMWQLYKKKPIYIIQTSLYSYQINFGKLDIQLPQDYRLRGEAIKKRKEEIFDSLEGLHFDHLTDWKRVYRLPQSPRFKDNKWSVVHYLSLESLAFQMNGGSLIGESTEQMKCLKNSFPLQKELGKTDCSVRSYSFSPYILNKINKEYFPILKYSGWEYKKAKGEVLKIMDVYNIKTYSSYTTLHYFYFVLNKRMSKERCNKVMKASHSDNKFCIERYGKTLMLVGNRVTKDYIVDVKPEFIEGDKVIDVFSLPSVVLKTNVPKEVFV